MCKRDGLQFSPAESRALSAFDGILPASKEVAVRRSEEESLRWAVCRSPQVVWLCGV